MEVAIYQQGKQILRVMDVAVDLNASAEVFDQVIEKKLSEESASEASEDVDLNELPEVFDLVNEKKLNEETKPLPNPVAFTTPQPDQKSCLYAKAPDAPKKRKLVKPNVNAFWELRQMQDFCPGAPRKRKPVRRLILSL